MRRVSEPPGPGPRAPDPGALADRAAALERRAMNAYRALAARFVSSDAGRRFAEMAEGEAAHFAILTLAADLARMDAPRGGAGEPHPDSTAREAAAIEAAELLVAALEAAAGEGLPAAAGLAAAVEAAVRFESQEMPRVAAFIAALPDRARTRARTGLGQTLPAHYAALEALGRLAGRDDLAAAARALAGGWRQEGA